MNISGQCALGAGQGGITLYLPYPTGQKIAPWSVDPPQHTHFQGLHMWGCRGILHLSSSRDALGQEGRRRPCRSEAGAYLGHAVVVVKTLLDQILILWILFWPGSVFGPCLQMSNFSKNPAKSILPESIIHSPLQVISDHYALLSARITLGQFIKELPCPLSNLPFTDSQP